MPPSTDDGSLRAYRARKDRPCDNCRSRRRRCVITTLHQPCELCAQTRKRCTFDRERPRKSISVPVDTAPAASAPQHVAATGADVPTGWAAPLLMATVAVHEHDLGSGLTSGTGVSSGPCTQPRMPLQPQQSQPTLANQSRGFDLSFLASSPVTPRPHASLPPSALVDLVRRGHQPEAAPDIDTFTGQALDDEAADDEELYLVGTAVERDALVLHRLASGTTHTPAYNNTSANIRTRAVSPTVSFVFYKSTPYEFEGSRGGGVFSQIKGLMDDKQAQDVLDRFFRIEGNGLPIFSDQQQPNDCLKAFCLTAGLIYTPTLRALHKSAYVSTMSRLRQRSLRARLWVLQVYLLDLNGREAINPSGNFLTLGLAVSTASLLGLNEDCSDWSIPDWEKDLRTRLWWALWVYDVLSAISFGRTRTILYDHAVPLPVRQPGNSSLNAFVFLCELAVIMDRLLPDIAEQSGANLDSLARAAQDLERWRERVDAAGTLLAQDASGDASPGVKSLHLMYLGANVIIVRETWNRAGQEPGVQLPCQYACLKACVEMAEFVHGLTLSDLSGYWASACPFILSFCLTLLIRLIVAADRQDQTDASVWQIGLFNLRKFITALTRARNQAQWDVADLSLSRASHFIPLLAQRMSELQVALLPLDSAPQEPAPVDFAALETFLASLLPADDFGQQSSVPAFPELGFTFDWQQPL